MTGIRIISTARAIPKKVVTNEDMVSICSVDDEWIYSRTGIKERHFCEGEESNLFLATKAGELAIKRSNINKDELGACIVATLTGDYVTPSTACLVQQQLDLPHQMPCFDINAACSGFLYGLQIIKGLLMHSGKKYGLLICCEELSKIINFNDKGTAPLFGDGAGAVIVELSENHSYYSVLGARGDDTELICKSPYSSDDFKLHMNGREVFKFAVDIVPKCIEEILSQSQLTMDDIDLFVCHQANKRIIDSAIKKMNANVDKFYINLDSYGNTSAASIPIALDEMMEKGLIKEGMKIICVGFGGGFTWGGALIQF